MVTSYINIEEEHTQRLTVVLDSMADTKTGPEVIRDLGLHAEHLSPHPNKKKNSKIQPCNPHKFPQERVSD